MSQTPYQSPMGGTPAGRVRLDVIGEAWSLYSKNFGPWVLAGLAYMVIFGIIFGVFYGISIAILGTMLKSAGAFAALLSAGMMMLGMAVAMAASAVIMGGATRMALNESRGIRAELSMLFSETSRLGDLVVAQLIIGVVAAIGSMCCYIPGLIWMGLTMLTMPLIIDRKMSAMDAIKTSIETMKPQMAMATIAYLVLYIIAGICSIFTLPLLFLGVTLVYRDMIGGADGVTVAVAAPAPVAEPVAEMPAEEPAAPAEEPAPEEAPTEEPKDEPQA